MKYYRIEHNENNKKIIKTIQTKKPISQLQKEFDKFLDLFKKPANAVMRKIQDVQSKIFMQKVKSKSQDKNQGMKR